MPVIYHEGYSLGDSGGGGGGHTIINSSGIAVTQRDGLQFSGMNITDDSANNRTVVQGQVKVCETQAAWNQLSQAEKDDPNTYWFLPWLTNITGSIDDSTTAADKVWSSQKTNNSINTVANGLNTVASTMAAPFDVSKTYYANEFFTYNGKLYQVLNFVSQVTGVTPPNPDYYVEETVVNELDTIWYYVEHTYSYSADVIGITGVNALKRGGIVELHASLGPVSPTANQWVTIGTLPSVIRPKMVINHLGWDNYTNDPTKALILFRIHPSGVFQYYPFIINVSNVYPNIVVTYITESDS